MLSENESYYTRKIKVDDAVVLERCSSLGADSMTVTKGTKGVHSMLITRELCSRNNLDGDEYWMYKPVTRNAGLEAKRVSNRIWAEDKRNSAKGELDRLTTGFRKRAIPARGVRA